jgi:hypothetical protein
VKDLNFLLIARPFGWVSLFPVYLLRFLTLHCLIGRVIRIERPTIGPDVMLESVQLDPALGAVMTIDAERLQIAQHEFVEISAVGLDVTGDCRGCDSARCQTESAQRLDRQLMAAAAAPGLRVVPGV